MLEKSFDRWAWVRDLVKAEEQMEESGIVDMSIGLQDERTLLKETLQFLNNLKNEFIEASQAFNQLKSSPLGRIKVYGIAKTEADFMLFRNGFKMIFSLKNPGVLSIRFNFFGPQSVPQQMPSPQFQATSLMEEHVVEARQAPFGDIHWTYQGETIKVAALVKYHMVVFIRESSK